MRVARCDGGASRSRIDDILASPAVSIARDDATKIVAVSIDDIQWLVATKGVPWKIAAQAYADAEKAAKARRPSGLAALDHAATEPSLREQALRLLDEPARQPAAVEALARVKKESKQPIQACRAALAEANYDADKALALLRSRPAPDKPRKPATSSTKATKREAPKAIHSLFAMSGPDAGRVVLLAQRRRPLTEVERREHPEDRPYDADRCAVYASEGGWRRRARPGPLDDVWVDDDGRVTVLRAGVIHMLDHVAAAESTTFVIEGARPKCLAGRHGVGEVAFDPFRAKKHVIGWRPHGAAWTELPLPSGISSPLQAEVTADRIWLAGWGQTIASWDGQGWTHATVEHASETPPPGVFNCFGVSPTGEVLASREGTLFAGDRDGVREVCRAGYREVTSIVHFAGRFWVAHTRRGICRWTGDQLVSVAPIKGLTVPAQIEPLRLSARTSLLAMSAGELLESMDGATFRTITTSQQIARVVGTDDVSWAAATDG